MIKKLLRRVRRTQRKLFAYIAMRFDSAIYSVRRSEKPLEHEVFKTASTLINETQEFKYQQNKVHNLKLATATMQGLIIKPGETFSFWWLARHAEKYGKYRDGLVVIDGKLTKNKGGGLCQLSNLLFWAFLHSPLTVTERHSHSIRTFACPDDGIPIGIDATVAEGISDLKAKNDTEASFALYFGFEDGKLTLTVTSDKPATRTYRVYNKNLVYSRRGGRVYEKVGVFRSERTTAGAQSAAHDAALDFKLYDNFCEIGYELPFGTRIEEENHAKDGIGAVRRHVK